MLAEIFIFLFLRSSFLLQRLVEKSFRIKISDTLVCYFDFYFSANFFSYSNEKILFMPAFKHFDRFTSPNFKWGGTNRVAPRQKN